MPRAYNLAGPLGVPLTGPPILMDELDSALLSEQRGLKFSKTTPCKVSCWRGSTVSGAALTVATGFPNFLIVLKRR